MGLVIEVSHLLILVQVLLGCPLIMSLSLRCLLRCNRAPPQNLLSHNTLLECLGLGLLRVTLHLAYGFALLIHCLPALQSFSDGISPDLMNCQTVDSCNDCNIPSSRLWGMCSCGVLEVTKPWVKHGLIQFYHMHMILISYWQMTLHYMSL